MAIEAPGIRESVRRTRRIGWFLVASGIVLIVAFVLAVRFVDRRSDELHRTGARVPGTVTSYRPGGHKRSPRLEVSFRFEGRSFEKRVHLSSGYPEKEIGDVITVIVDPDDPDHMTVPGETNQSIWTAGPMFLMLVGGIGCVVGGMWLVLRALRQRRLLRRWPWRRVRARYGQKHGAKNSVIRLLMVDEGSPPALLKILAGLGVFPTNPPEFLDVEIAGPIPGYVVIRKPDGEKVASARSPRTGRGRQSWLSAYRPHRLR